MNDLITTQKPGTAMAMPAETQSNVLAAQAKALVEARFVMAYRNPRNEDEVREKLLKECRRPSFAGVAIYSKPVGSKRMEGPSIRFAEAAIRISKNITVDSPTVYEDDMKRIIRVSVSDLEANSTYSTDVVVNKTVERRQLRDGQVAISSRMNTGGQLVHLIEASEDELITKQAALVSKAIRTNGMRLIPGDLVDECMWIVRQTMKNEDAADPDAAKRRLFDAFGELGVTVKNLQAWLGHEGNAINPAELEALRTIYRGLHEGETTWQAVMEQRQGERAPEGGEDKPRGFDAALKKTGAGKKSAPAPEPSLDQKIHDAMVAAKDEDALNKAWEFGGPDWQAPAEFVELYNKRAAELRG